MSSARGIMTEVMFRFGKKRNAKNRVLEAVKALPKLSVNDLSNPAARELFEELSRRLSASGPWSTTAAGMSDADAEQIANMIRRLDQLVE